MINIAVLQSSKLVGMIFTEIDRKTMQSLCTLAKLVSDPEAKREEIVVVGQHLGVPKEDTLEVLEEWDETDTLELHDEEDKRGFVNFCFSYLTTNYNPKSSELELYGEVVSTLGLKTRSDN
ncbi:hypothetical protein [Marinoscillum pacificum]|uniref:hypothetical protein n=1 Tax=Marinoscillum pacificum TaxID=392723 RepID=UPI0021581271|nr:hypothetical protein [Marinoscillum pacificum]